MDKARAQRIVDDMKKALRIVEAAHNVKIEYNGGSLDGSTLKPKIVVCEIDSTGLVETPELVALRQFYPHLEGKTKNIDGVEYNIIGYRPRATKRPFVIQHPVTGEKLVTMNA